ncbi:hypothetical protein TOT_020001039 [Theileria orientalis strain Shintoku]|uniref:Uncharacterized protein n=1 Tax=Theileria orientalis strain Shintoku TaxID=869250 RepID=J4D765_THEOR|nr:hypothetical protein TOT_020001039 [Theileria orientalis strain Shintoku]BAM39990.1 hypothetical protein TOT_020001039 [Theileria orientalis strain Shintoku]|eukprot:XP_009690291.1 hypothetical protein TOT_020001039 [Theileria orientalis strain Shintoku]
MESNIETKCYKGVQKLNKLYVLISVSAPSSSESQNHNGFYISTFDFESYFKSNILLQYGILGYLGFPFKVIEFIKNKNCFIVQINSDCLSKLQLIVNNIFPAHSPIEFSFNGTNGESKVKFEILKFNNSLSSLIDDDLVLNTT